jgi:hypothetical protein
MPQVPRPIPVQPSQDTSQALGQLKERQGWYRTAKEAGPMTVSVPLVMILGVTVFIAYRYMGLRAWQAVLCLLAGFLLAATTAAPQIRTAIAAVVHWLGGGSRP